MRRKMPTRPMHRRIADAPHNTAIAVDVVDDPYSIGEKIHVVRSLRNDPLAGLMARNFIDRAQFAAGRKWQMYAELAEIGTVKAIDPGKVNVDGRLLPDAYTDSQRKAMRRLIDARDEIGSAGDRMLRRILIDGQTLKQVAAALGLTSARELDFIGRSFRAHLEAIAKLWGLA